MSTCPCKKCCAEEGRPYEGAAMKLEPVAWRVDSSKQHHFTLYDAKQVPLWEARAGWDRDVKITAMFPPIPPGYVLVKIDAMKAVEHAQASVSTAHCMKRLTDDEVNELCGAWDALLLTQIAAGEQ